MGTLTVWRFDSAGGAQQALGSLERLAKEGLVALEDAALVTWPAGAAKPQTKQLHDLADELERPKGDVALIDTNLSADEETKLREVFVEEAAVLEAS